jgi:hypothetical protein
VRSWQHSETGDEALDRALFAQRARALPAPAIPSLSAILAAADAPALAVDSAPRPRDERQANVRRLERPRTWIPGMIAAAACMAALLGARGRLGEPRSIVAEDDADGAHAGNRAGVSWAAAEVCTPETDAARGFSAWVTQPLALASRIEPVGACVAPPPVSAEVTSLEITCESELACHLADP